MSLMKRVQTTDTYTRNKLSGMQKSSEPGYQKVRQVMARLSDSSMYELSERKRANVTVMRINDLYAYIQFEIGALGLNPSEEERQELNSALQSIRHAASQVRQESKIDLKSAAGSTNVLSQLLLLSEKLNEHDVEICLSIYSLKWSSTMDKQESIQQEDVRQFVRWNVANELLDNLDFHDGSVTPISPQKPDAQQHLNVARSNPRSMGVPLCAACCSFRIFKQDVKNADHGEAKKSCLHWVGSAVSIMMLVLCVHVAMVGGFASHRLSEIQLFGLLLIGSGLGLVMEILELFMGVPFNVEPFKFWGSAIMTQRKGLAIAVYLSTQNVIFEMYYPRYVLHIDLAFAVLSGVMYVVTCSLSMMGERSFMIPVAIMLSCVMGALWDTTLPEDVSMIAVRAECLLLLSLLVSAATKLSGPWSASVYHLIVAGAGLVIQELGVRCPVADGLVQSHASWVILGGFAGFILGMLTSRKARKAVRATFSCLVWSLVHTLIFSRSTPKPRPLSADVSKHASKRIQAVPYSSKPGRHFPDSVHLKAMSAEAIPAWGDYKATAISVIFSCIRVLDRWLPTSKTQDDGFDDDDHVRMPKGSTPAMAVPRFLFHLGNGGGWDDVSDAMVEELTRSSSLLEWLINQGPANSMLTETEDFSVVLDFSHLNKYATKRNCISYGGVARFNRGSGPYVLEGVGHQLHGHFGQEGSVFKQLLQSIVLETVVGKHFTGLHLMGSMVPLAIHNAFNAQQVFNHPLQIWLHPHVYAHAMINELTTSHLIENGGVFSQIFGLRQADLHKYVSQQFEKPYAADCDWISRKKIYLNSVPDGSLLCWELKYYKLFETYFDTLINSCYPGDGDVNNDKQISGFYLELSKLVNLPARYRSFQTKQGLRTFLADTVYSVTVLHEIYGTKHMPIFLDTRLMEFQYNVDGKKPQWEAYMSSVFVSLATSRAAFPKLMDTDVDQHVYAIFDDIRQNDGGSARAVSAAKQAWKTLQMDLKSLSDEAQRVPNRSATGIVLPEDLELGTMY
eukprot:TRINITY_DN6279_c0_g1_i1.p1 TRINITY_DN6279_c0_g1~~TRINITY_DN6279_c0_g1_i1.p1  ORF type:complete len:1016 (-),score=126.31 TRINITY_DN6279_c0_g1_i1:387-3434(-)